MSYSFYHALHLFTVIILVAVLFFAVAAPVQERRRRTLMWSGIIAILALFSGFGLLAKIKAGFPAWILVKLIAWFALAAIPGLCYRKPHETKLWLSLGVICALVAVMMVSFKPF